MLRFKQYLIESSVFDNTLSWYDPDFPPEKSTKETPEQRDARQEKENQQSRLMDRATRFKGADPREHRIDTDLSPELQQLQQNIRRTAFEKQGLVAPHPEVTKQTSVGVYSPSLTDLEALERMGVVNAKNYTSDERGILYRPGQLPTEQQRQATALRATDVANAGGGLVTANTPEAKQRRSDSVRAFYTDPKNSKALENKPGSRIDPYGRKFSDRQLGIDFPVGTVHTPAQSAAIIQQMGAQRPSDLRKQLGLGIDSSAVKNLGAAGLAAAGSIVGGALTQGVQAGTDVLGMIGRTPEGKDRMQIEKSFNSDMGLGFDVGPDGELVADPAGREAARKRQQQGINFPSMFQK